MSPSWNCWAQCCADVTHFIFKIWFSAWMFKLELEEIKDNWVSASGSPISLVWEGTRDDVLKMLSWWFWHAVRTEKRWDVIQPEFQTLQGKKLRPRERLLLGSHLPWNKMQKICEANSWGFFHLFLVSLSSSREVELGPVVKIRHRPFPRTVYDPVTPSCPLFVSQVTWFPLLF